MTFLEIKTPLGVILLNLHFSNSMEDNHCTALNVRDEVDWFSPRAAPGVQRIESPGELISMGGLAKFRF